MAENTPDRLGTEIDLLPAGFAYAVIGLTIVGLIIWTIALLLVFIISKPH